MKIIIFAWNRSSEVMQIENNNYQTGISYNKWILSLPPKKTGSINVDHHGGVIKNIFYTDMSEQTQTNKS